jgi:hypothetical protein
MTWKDALLFFNEEDADVIDRLAKTEERLE